MICYILYEICYFINDDIFDEVDDVSIITIFFKCILGNQNYGRICWFFESIILSIASIMRIIFGF
jgi:hypothetical protein